MKRIVFNVVLRLALVLGTFVFLSCRHTPTTPDPIPDPTPVALFSIAPANPTVDFYGTDSAGQISKAKTIRLTVAPTPGTSVDLTACTWTTPAGTFSEIKSDGTALLTVTVDPTSLPIVTNVATGRPTVKATYTVKTTCGGKIVETSLTVQQTYTDWIGMYFHRVDLKVGGDKSKSPAAWQVFGDDKVTTQTMVACPGINLNDWNAGTQIWTCKAIMQVAVGHRACVTIADVERGNDLVGRQAGREIFNSDGSLIPLGSLTDQDVKFEAACGTTTVDGKIK